MSGTIAIQLNVDDKGSATINKFSKNTVNRVKELSTRSRVHISKLQTSFKKLGTGISSIGRTLMNLKTLAIGALMGWGIKQIAGSFLEAAKTTEEYRTRLTILLGSVEEGNKLFKAMAEYAGNTPFEFEKIMLSVTNLAGVMKGGVEEIKQWIPMIGDLAAATGLNIEKTAEQVGKMYSSGAGAADMFRDRGILAMLGFKAKVSYTAEETRRIMMESWNAMGSQFKGATDTLALTWKGMISTLKDFWFQFRSEVMDSGPFQAMKDGLSSVKAKITELKESGKLGEWATLTAQKVLGAMQYMIKGIDLVADAFIGWKYILEGLRGTAGLVFIGIAKGVDFLLAGLKKAYGGLIKYYELQNKFVGWLPILKVDTDAYARAVEALGGAQGFAGEVEGFFAEQLGKSVTNLDSVTKKQAERKEGIQNIIKALEDLKTHENTEITPKINTEKPILQLKQIEGQWHITQDIVEHNLAVPQINKSLSQKQLNSIIDDWARTKNTIEANPAKPKVIPQIVKSPPVPWSTGIQDMQTDLNSLGKSIGSTLDLSSLSSQIGDMRMNLERAFHHSAHSGLGGPVNVAPFYREHQSQMAADYREMYDMQMEILQATLSSMKPSTPGEGAVAYPYGTETSRLPRNEVIIPENPVGARVQSTPNTYNVELNVVVPDSAAPQKPEDWRYIVREFIKPELERLN